MDSGNDPFSPWYSESLNNGFKRRKRKVLPTSVMTEVVNSKESGRLGGSSSSIPQATALRMNALHRTVDNVLEQVRSNNSDDNTGILDGEKIDHFRNPSLKSTAYTNVFPSPANSFVRVPLSDISNRQFVQNKNLPTTTRRMSNTTSPIILSAATPLADLTNRQYVQPIRKEKRIMDKKVGEVLCNTLFPDEPIINENDRVDYENIDQSKVVGYSDSEPELDSGESESEDNDESDGGVEIDPMKIEEDSELNEHKAWCARMIREVPAEYNSLGPPNAICKKCGASMWKQERTNKANKKGQPEFTLCCKGGRIVLPPIQPTPNFLKELYNDKEKGPGFKRCIRMYNSMFSFTSMGGHVDDSVNKGGGPYVYRLNGQNHHQIGSLLPIEGEQPKFCQLYIYDTDNELQNRMRWIDIKDSHNVDPTVVEGLLKMLDESNHLVKCFRMARDRFKNEDIVDLKIVLKQSRSESGRENHVSASDEVAAILVGDMDETCGRRDIVLESKIHGLTRISDIHPLLMALQYPLLFPYGEEGFHEQMYYIKQPGDSIKVRETVSMREFYSHRFMVRKNEGQTLRMGGRLLQQYMVDAFSAVEQSRLWYYRSNQTALRNELYTHICDFMKKGDADLSNLGRSFILPSSFVGSKRYFQQNFQDSLAVCRFIGHPDLFLTMTCNPLWDEVLQMLYLLPVSRPHDCPDIIARVFKLKLQQLTYDIKKRRFFGKCIAVMYVVEWQKRGLPHVHMLIWLDGPSKSHLNKNIDKFVSAEIPDPVSDPNGYAAVKMFMIHGPCGADRPKSPCMRNKKCIRHFPKRYCARTMFDQSGFPIYKRRKTGLTVKVRKTELDNQWVVPYNRELLLRYQCHINIEICNHARCLKYLFKYCLKGSDRATVQVKSKKKHEHANTDEEQIDEINRFFDGRYVCGAEACHRMFAFDIHHRTVGVERLGFHLEGKKSVTWRNEDKIHKVVANERYKNSKLEAFFKLCTLDAEARQFTYEEIPQHYTWNGRDTQWNPRKKGKQIGRLSYTHHSNGEVWYMRMLLLKVRGPTSFQALRTIEGKIYSTYQDACKALGLLDDDKEWDAVLKECKISGMPIQIRNLFVQIIVNNNVSDVKQLWESHWQSMADDILLMQKAATGLHELHLSDTELQFFALAEIDKILRSIGKSIKDFKQLPQPPERYLSSSRQNLVFEETNYNIDELAEEHKVLCSKLNNEQREVYDSILQSVRLRKGGVFFVYGSGGCGKTFLWKTIITKLRSESKIVIPVASSGIAATLLPGGRTAHSRFKIPILLDDLSTCSIAHKSDIAELLKKTDLIIWDEAPMQHRYAFESVDRTLRDIMKSVNSHRAEMPFGGITVLLGGDFRQILPVISRGSRSDIVASCITRSRIWEGCKIFQLSQNMRLTKGETDEDIQSIKKFAKWVLDVGDGKSTENITDASDDGDESISIPLQYCIDGQSDNLNALIDTTFPNLQERFNQAGYLSERAILTPTNETVSHINGLILDIIPGEQFTYFSSDKAEFVGGYNHEIDREYPVEYLNALRLPGLPAHEIKLKAGVLVMLIRNLNQTLGLCNGTRMIVIRCMKNVVECEVIAGPHVGEKHFIPKMELSPSDSRLPFKLIRRQFPLQVCYAMTINKSQGQSLEVVGLYLPKGVFTHGQLYVALSRVTSPLGLHILIDAKDGKPTNITTNVVYDEVFYSLPKAKKIVSG